MKIKLFVITTLAAACTLASGCATQTNTESEFGNSVRAVTASQIYDMGAALYPDKEAITGGNGDRLEKVVNVHSGNVSAPSSVETPISLNTSSSSQSGSR
jgi:hypothetical protein